MSVADASFEEAWDIAKAHPLEIAARIAAITGGPAPGYMSVMGNKGSPMHQAINRYLYGRASARDYPRGDLGGLRLIEPFFGGGDVAFAIRPEQGLFGSDKNRLLSMTAEQIRDNPEKVSFDPRRLLSFPGDELSVYDKPGSGNFDPVATFELPSDVFRDVKEDRIYDGGVYLPMKYYQLRAEFNRKLKKFNRGETSTREEQELAGDLVGLQRAMMNSIQRYNKEGYLSSAAGGKDDTRQHSRIAYADQFARELADMGLKDFPVTIDSRSGGTQIGGRGSNLGIGFGPGFIPQRMGQVSRDPEDVRNPLGDISPYNLEPWSDMMQNYYFENKDFRDFFGGLKLRPRKDKAVMDPPYAGEVGQHAEWDRTDDSSSTPDTDAVYRFAREFRDMGIPSVTYNDASPATIAAIRREGLPISMILGRRDRQSANKGADFKIKPETVVASIPGMDSDFMRDFERELERPKITGFRRIEDIPDFMFNPAKAQRLAGELTEEQKMKKNRKFMDEYLANLPATTVSDPMTGVSRWMETNPELLDIYRGKGYFAQPRYDELYGRTIA